MANIKVKRNFFGKFKSVSKDHIKYNHQRFEEFYLKLEKEAEKKLRIKNIIYEISRL